MFLVEIYREVPGIPLFLCSVHSRITCPRASFVFLAMLIFFQKIRTAKLVYFLKLSNSIKYFFRTASLDESDRARYYLNIMQQSGKKELYSNNHHY